MIVALRLYRPVAGRLADLRSVLTEWVRERQTFGLDSALLQRAYSSAPAHLISITRHADLASLQTHARETRSSEAFRTYQARLTPLLAAPSTARFYESLLPVAGTVSGREAADAVVVRHRFRPAIGRAAELERLLCEWTEHLRARGHRLGLQRRVLADDGPALVGVEVHESLAAYGDFLSVLTTTEDFHAFMHTLNPLLEEHVTSRLFEVVVRFPS